MKIIKCTQWDARFFLLCDLIASWSEDESRKVGSVIVGAGNSVLATGYNGFPRNIDSSVRERHSRTNGEKYLWFEHAERNAIYNLLNNSTSGPIDRMYVNSFPCADCTRAIIQSGIRDLRTFAYSKEDEKFCRHFDVATQMLKEASVSLKIYSRKDHLMSGCSDNFLNTIDPKNNFLR